MVAFDITYQPISNLRVNSEQCKRTGRPTVTSVEVAGEPLKDTERFWTSLFARYGINESFFKYFSHAEVFERITEMSNRTENLRLCIERDGEKQGRLLAVSNPNKPIANYEEVRDLMESYDGDNFRYDTGILESTHAPSVDAPFTIGGDTFNNRFLLSVPVDGYGMPTIYLSLLRMVCSNGFVAYSRAFRSQLNLGRRDRRRSHTSDDVRPTLRRVLEGFGNEEGYAALRQRTEASQKSWASIREAQGLLKILTRGHISGGIEGARGSRLERFLSPSPESALPKMPMYKAFEGMAGDIPMLYGLANIDALSTKRQSTLPARCSVYDLLNFATEVSTHHATPTAARRLNAWVGDVISNEYDLENSREEFGDFQDFFLGTSKVAVAN